MLIYNPDKVKEPPKTFTDLLDPKWKGKVGVGDVNYFYVMMAAANAATGDPNKVDSDEAKALVEKLNENGLRLYASTDAIGAGLKSGEIEVGLIWLARVNMWQNAGIPIRRRSRRRAASSTCRAWWCRRTRRTRRGHTNT